jgi:hypothetical protein
MDYFYRTNPVNPSSVCFSELMLDVMPFHSPAGYTGIGRSVGALLIRVHSWFQFFIQVKQQ